MQVFKKQDQNQEEVLLRTAIELYERDKSQNQNQRTAEQVLAELDIPIEYLDRAKAEMTQRQLLKQNRFFLLHSTNRLLVAGALAVALALVFLVAAFQLVHSSASIPPQAIAVRTSTAAPPESFKPPVDDSVGTGAAVGVGSTVPARMGVSPTSATSN